MEAFVRSQIEEGIGTIEFFHPQSNAMPGIQLSNLATEITKLGADPEVRVIVLKSAGERVFCAGASFDELISIRDSETGLTFFSGFAQVINAMRKAPKFVIVRVQGKTVGGGVGIAAAGDYTLGTVHASVKLSELAIGIGPFVVGPAVQRKMGLSAFSQMTIDATTFHSAEWALQKGLYAEVFEEISALDDAVASLAKRLAASSPQATQEIKQMLWSGTEDWDQLLIKRAEISGRLVLSDFTRDAIASFKKKG